MSPPCSSARPRSASRLVLLLVCLLPVASLRHTLAAVRPAVRAPRCTPAAAVASTEDVITAPRLTAMSLPVLEEDERHRLRAGERVSRQQPPESGGAGSGFSVQEVCLSPAAAWAVVSDFEGYAERIKTVRTVTRYVSETPGSEGAPCFNFLVSRIRLVLNVRFDIDEASR